jgi:Ca2+-binding RTX toxin-like protein
VYSSAGTQIYGDAGNDAIGFASGASTIDGGADNDTLILTGNIYSASTFDLGSAGDQEIGSDTYVTGFENIDFSGFYGQLDVTGSTGANVIVGNYYDDVLSGLGGADTLDGGSGYNELIGGSGADVFRFIDRDGQFDRITDFSGAGDQDKLYFEHDSFDFNGPTFQTVITSNGAGSLATADLIRYNGGIIDHGYEVGSFLGANGTGAVGEGVFVIGSNSDGETVLFHAVDASQTINGDVVMVANLGTTPIAQVNVADFVFG